MRLQNRKRSFFNSGFKLFSFLAICLLGFSCCDSSEAKENESSNFMKMNSNSNPEMMELRLRKLENDFLERKTKETMESELQANRLSKLETQLKAQGEKFSAIENKQEFQFNRITKDFDTLKRSLFDNKRQEKRAAKEIDQSSKKICSDSSRLCTFFYPDHPDVNAAVKSNGKTSYTTIQNVLNSKVNVNSPPASCKDLKQLGHTLNSYYLIKKTYKNMNQIQAVYCDFNELNVSESIIGNVELKTKDVHFYVQRKSKYSNIAEVIRLFPLK